jgi:eukaryotic-like serine/threonine-protein kinase
MRPTSDLPQVSDRYRLLRPLGAGGMGRVWLGQDEVLHRDVAIKEVIPPAGLTESESDQAATRGLREARAIARLNHPNVVRIYDVVTAEPHPWIVMEYVPSRSLQQVLEEDGPMRPAEAARIGLGVLAALVAAHRAGVLHRDVKPSNVLLAEDRVVLTDFGLATLAGDSTVTRTGQILGSPAYIAPERARDGTTGPESDLWSLGATLYAAVEGRSPYQRSTAIGTLTALATEPPDRMTHAGPLGRVLKGLLDKDPRSRMGAAEAERRLRRVAGLPARRGGSAAGWPRQRRPAPPPTPPVPVSPSVPVSPAAVGVAQVPMARTAVDAQPPGSAQSSAGLDVLGPDVGEPDAPTAGAAGATGYRRLSVAALAVLLLFLLGALGVGVLLHQGRSPDAGTQAGASSHTSPSSAGTPSAAPASSAPAPSPTPASAGPSAASGAALPAGWHWYHDQTDFTVAVPDGWSMSRRDGIVYFKDPSNGRLLGIDQTNQPHWDPVADWTQQSQYRVAHGDFPGYQQIKIASVDYHLAAADWEFTYDDNGVRTHVINRGAVFGQHQAYGFYWSTPDSLWASNLPNFQLITSTFQGRQG